MSRVTSVARWEAMSARTVSESTPQFPLRSPSAQHQQTRLYSREKERRAVRAKEVNTRRECFQADDMQAKKAQWHNNEPSHQPGATLTTTKDIIFQEVPYAWRYCPIGEQSVVGDR
jgi:hypothetical protein